MVMRYCRGTVGKSTAINYLDQPWCVCWAFADTCLHLMKTTLHLRSLQFLYWSLLHEMWLQGCFSWMAYNLVMKKFHKELQWEYLSYLPRELLRRWNLIGHINANLIIIHYSASGIPIPLVLLFVVVLQSLDIIIVFSGLYSLCFRFWSSYWHMLKLRDCFSSAMSSQLMS